MVLNSKATAENVRHNQGLQVSLFSSNFLFTYPVLSLFSVNKYKCMVYTIHYTMLGVDESETLLLLCRRCERDVESPPEHLQSHQSSLTPPILSPSQRHSPIYHFRQSETCQNSKLVEYVYKNQLQLHHPQ